jgi:hypothetical protein
MDKLKKIDKCIFSILCDGRDKFSFIAGIIVSGYVVEISINPGKNCLHWLTVIIGLGIGILLYSLIKECGKFETEEIKLKNDQKNDYARTSENIEQILKCVTGKEKYKDYILPINMAKIKLAGIIFLFVFAIFIYQRAESKNTEKEQQTILNRNSKQDSINNDQHQDFILNFDTLKKLNRQQSEADSINNIKLDSIIG